MTNKTLSKSRFKLAVECPAKVHYSLDRLAREEVEEEASLFVANGGAAMVAYGQLQQRGLPAEERRRLEGQLLRYCELDTLAMVMVYEALREWVRA